MEMNSEHWETPAPLPDMEQELKRIRRDLRRRSWKIVLTSIMLVIAILFTAIQYGIPTLEAQYWNPKTCSYSEETTDLEYALHAFSELFCAQQRVANMFTTKTGFATYEITVQLLAEEGERSNTFLTTSLCKGKLDFPLGFWNTSDTLTALRDSSITKQNLKAQLATLPNNFIRLRAYVSFSEDISMDELLEFKVNTLFSPNMNNVQIEWVGIRTDDEENIHHPLSGINLNKVSTADASINQTYPAFIDDRSDYENHYISLLKYSLDQQKAGTGISSVFINDDFYEKALNYVEENGVMSYGCFLTASPGELYHLLDNDLISTATITDSWLDIG